MPGNYFFARFYDPFIDPYIRKIRYKVLELAGKYQPGNILDACCGTGHQLKLLRKHGFHVTGLDLSDQMLKISRRGKHAVTCIKADATDMPFEDNFFDMGMVSLALHENHPETAEKIINELFRVVKANGTIIIVDYDISGHTRRDARVIIKTIEWLAGGDHHRNFRKYLEMGGPDHLLKSMPCKVQEEFRYAGNSIVIKVLTRQVANDKRPA